MVLLFILHELIYSRKITLINLDIVLSCPNIQDNNRYNNFIQFSIQHQDYGDKNAKNLVLSWK